MVLFKNKLSFTGFAGLFANLLKTGAAISVSTLLSCSGDSSSGNPIDEQNADDVSVAETEITGVTQKGPFLMGSKVQMFEISNGHSLNQTGKSFNGKISNDKGEFKINGSKLVSQYVVLEASGYYRNEITGKNSNSELTLLAISDVKDRNTININLLTHLEYERVNYLVTEENAKVDEAKKQAQKEILKIFDIDNKNFSNSEDLNIAGSSDEDGALLAISIMLQGDRSESQLSELLTKIAIDMEKDGEWNDDSKRNEIADWAAEIVQSGRIESIRENIEKWKLSNVVPNFEKYINNFWWNNYGFAACDKDHNGKILQNANKQSEKYQTYYICKDGLWKEASALEFDTYQWASGKDGDDKYGSVNSKNCYVFEDKVWRSGNASDCSLGLRGCTALRQDTVGKGNDKIYHICDKKSWRNATTYEKDTFGWKDSTGGAIKKGNVTDTVYVFDKNIWRASSNVESKLGGCVSAIADSVGKVGSAYYICKSNKWVEASAIEYDTYRWNAGKDGDSKWGSVNTKNCYVYENKVWRRGNTSDCSLKLRGCTALRQDTVGKGSDNVWHKCDTKSWRNATTYEKDTFGWKDSTDGAIKKGYVTDSIYVFDKTVWRATSIVEAKLGGCVSAIADSVGKVGSTYYICKSNKWVEASAIEYDTYRWNAGKNGEVRSGQINKAIYYIYETNKNAWRNATTLEKDTYDHKNNKGWADGVDGEIKKGSLTDSIYVFDATAWRTADDIEKVLGGCVSAIQDSVGKVGDVYYICNPRKWNVATTLQYDTYKRECFQDGKMFNGNVNATTKYVCDNSVFRAATEIEVEADSTCTSYNRNEYYILSKYDGKNNYSYYKCTENGWIFTTDKLNQGSMIDERDGHEYKTIGIKSQMWMAENLNYAYLQPTKSLDSSSFCYNNSIDFCETYGRLYLWSAAIDSVYWANQGLVCGYAKLCSFTNRVKGVCPDGWHLPTQNEWIELANNVDPNQSSIWNTQRDFENSASEELRSTSGWFNNGYTPEPNGKDTYGFSAMPAGGRVENCGGNGFCYEKELAYFWSVDNEDYFAYDMRLSSGFKYASILGGQYKKDAYSVRCVKDDE
ncbi:fibrobacter succinogenes major paralogous domain-containing protein [Fibrobacter sp. UWB7]|uniref:fibrobacter succinogenes major paralogous domain-containing protein n=1 Tax=Fibrobacter sp. UWB7 TaxID=1896206 RepID=UPI0009131540|nr:fibrobacter succinogenes major paralogous domain-containing protein [Fibrobacter sp. UWB7]SHM07100.1 major paralogous domain-containing protein [Fibrobacter sp. UWB7]